MTILTASEARIGLYHLIQQGMREPLQESA